MVEPEKAEQYRMDYVRKEKEFEADYEHQQELMNQSSRELGHPPQQLHAIVKNDWDPRHRFASTKGDAPEKKEPTELAPKAAEVPAGEIPINVVESTEKLTEEEFRELPAAKQKELVEELVTEENTGSNVDKRVSLYLS